MKIGEVLELTQTTNIATIAKQIDGISEKPLRALLREVGCVHHSGKKGWEYEGNDPDILERSIFDFTKPKANKKTETQKTTKETKQEKNYTESKPTKKEVNKKTKKVTYEIEELLHDKLKILAIMQKRNVSEIVNEIIKKGLG